MDGPDTAAMGRVSRGEDDGAEAGGTKGRLVGKGLGGEERYKHMPMGLVEVENGKFGWVQGQGHGSWPACGQ